jgi:hypothetical protein
MVEDYDGPLSPRSGVTHGGDLVRLFDCSVLSAIDLMTQRRAGAACHRRHVRCTTFVTSIVFNLPVLASTASSISERKSDTSLHSRRRQRRKMHGFPSRFVMRCPEAESTSNEFTRKYMF